MDKIHENIKKLRKERGWTQDMLAKKCGYTDRSSIARIEKGEFDLPQSKVLEFAKAFGISVTDLIGDVPQMTEDEENTIRLNQFYNSMSEENKERLLDYAYYLSGKE